MYSYNLEEQSILYGYLIPKPNNFKKMNNDGTKNEYNSNFYSVVVLLIKSQPLLLYFQNRGWQT